MNISVEKAVNLIDSTIQLHDGNHVLPYFFIVGAGVSAPEIPLAGGIVELCKNEIKRRNTDYYNRCVTEMQQFESDPTKNYSGWIERAYPNSVDRSRFFKSIITKAKISSANLMLAHILSSKKISTTVFTTNFDDKLKQALELIGVNDLFVAENAMDNLVVSPQNDGIQVIHVHGTYNFYDCANLEHEIRAVANQNNTISSYRVLANFLLNQAPIIVGYSGWENDVIMTCLKERLSYATPLTYIWVCYSRENYDALPEWIKTSPNVSFVIPGISDFGCDDEIAVSQFMQSKTTSTKDTLSATMFFNMLISSIKLSVPEIFENPFSYYSKLIENILPQHEDILHLRHWANRMKYFGLSDSPFEKLIKQLEHADVTNDISTATSVITEISKLKLPMADVCFTSEDLIRGMLEKESSFDSFDAKYKFRMAVLEYIESNYESLLTKGILNDCLCDVFLGRWKKEDNEQYIALLDRVVSIAQKSDATFEARLRALGIKSAIVPENETSIALLNEMLNLSEAHLDDAVIKFIHCIALYDLAVLSSVDEAVTLIETADKLICKDKGMSINVKAMKSKSQVLPKLKDTALQNTWITQIKKLVSANFDRLDSYDVLEISVNLARIACMSDLREITDFLIEVYNKCASLDYSFCEHAFWMSEVCIALVMLTGDSSESLNYYNTFKVLSEKIPVDCKKNKDLQQIALHKYCLFPISIVPDQKKAEEIAQYKLKHPDDEQAIIEAILYAYENGDIAVYENCCDLEEEAAYCHKRHLLALGFDAYVSKQFEEAEHTFSKLQNCGYPDLESLARNDLAFMIRRKETTFTQCAFWDTIKDVSDSHIFKHMNIVLFCRTEGLMDDPRYQTSIQHLKIMSYQDAMALYQCWSNTEMVGESESELALSIMMETADVDISSITTPTEA